MSPNLSAEIETDLRALGWPQGVAATIARPKSSAQASPREQLLRTCAIYCAPWRVCEALELAALPYREVCQHLADTVGNSARMTSAQADRLEFIAATKTIKRRWH